MESKPLRVQAAEACGLELFQANGLHGALTWMIAERNSPGRILPLFDSDDSAALELLKAWQLIGPDNRRWRITSTEFGQYGVVLTDYVEYRRDNKCLALAICQALVATREGGK